MVSNVDKQEILYTPDLVSPPNVTLVLAVHVGIQINIVGEPHCGLCCASVDNVDIPKLSPTQKVMAADQHVNPLVLATSDYLLATLSPPFLAIR